MIEKKEICTGTQNMHTICKIQYIVLKWVAMENMNPAQRSGLFLNSKVQQIHTKRRRKNNNLTA